MVAAARTPVGAATAGTSESSSGLIAIIFGIAIGLALLVIALPLMQAQAVPRPLLNVVEEHHGDLLIAGVTAILSILVSFLITQAGS